MTIRGSVRVGTRLVGQIASGVYGLVPVFKKKIPPGRVLSYESKKWGYKLRSFFVCGGGWPSPSRVGVSKASAFRFVSRTVCSPYRTRLSTCGDRASPVAAVRTWNSLPQHITSAPSLPVFCSRLKTYFFEVTVSFMDTLIALTYLLLSNETPTAKLPEKADQIGQLVNGRPTQDAVNDNSHQFISQPS